jgi:acyl carrier protein
MGLDIVELVLEIEASFGIEIPHADAVRLDTVGKLFDYVRARVAEPGEAADGAGPYAGALWERYCDVVAKATGAPRADLRPQARFVADLGLD